MKDRTYAPQEKLSGIQNAFDWLESVIFSLIVVIFIFTFLCRIVGVKGPSMQNTLIEDDRIVISRVFYQPRPKDVIVISHATNYMLPLVKRVIATEGQTVDIDFMAGDVFVDGQILDEPYIKNRTLNASDVTFPLTVPQGFVFVMGDNRAESLDSRSTQIGFIDVRDIMGRVLIRVFPLEKFGGL